MRRALLLFVLGTSFLLGGCATYNHTPRMRRAAAHASSPRARVSTGEAVLTTFEAAATLTGLGLDIAAAVDDD